jgi:hypothetical protein
VIAGQSVGSLVIIGDDEIEALRGLSVLAPRPHNQVGRGQAADPASSSPNRVSALTRPCKWSVGDDFASAHDGLLVASERLGV